MSENQVILDEDLWGLYLACRDLLRMQIGPIQIVWDVEKRLREKLAPPRYSDECSGWREADFQKIPGDLKRLVAKSLLQPLKGKDADRVRKELYRRGYLGPIRELYQIRFIIACDICDVSGKPLVWVPYPDFDPYVQEPS